MFPGNRLARYSESPEWDYEKPLPPPHIEIPRFKIYDNLVPQTESLEDSLLLGYAYLKRRDWNGAWRRFSFLDESEKRNILLIWVEKLCKTNPASAMAFVLKGDVIARLGRYDEAIAALDHAIELDPKSALAYDLRGLVRIAGGALGGAVEDLEKALKIDPQMYNALYELALNDLIAGEFERAAARLTNLLDNEPKFFLARNARGVAYLLQAKYDLAFQDFDQVILDNPDFVDARNNKVFGTLLRAKDIFNYKEDIRKLAKITAKGVLGSLTMIIGDRNSIQTATDIAIRSNQEFMKNRPIITNNLDRAISIAKAGDNVIYQRTVNSIGSIPQLQPIVRNIDRFSESMSLVHKLADKTMPTEMKLPLNFTGAVMMDLKSARSGQFNFLTSHTLERIGKYGMKELPKMVNILKDQGKLSSTFNLSPLLSGLPDITVGIASQIGRRKALPTVGEITHYLDGINKASWATVGALVGGPKGASIASTAAGLTAENYHFKPCCIGQLRQNS